MASDDFWNIDKLLPKKKYSYKTENINVNLINTNESIEKGASIKALLNINHSHTEKIDIFRNYDTSSSSVLIKAFISQKKNEYIYFDTLEADAKHFSSLLPPAFAEYVPYFSYTPDCKSFSERQKLWYLFWRENVRNSVFLPNDFSYIYLYVYEIFNSSEEDTAASNLKILLSLWKNYHIKFPQITKHMYDWIMDFCIFYNLPLPLEELGTILPYINIETDSILKNCYIFDFLLQKQEFLNLNEGIFLIDSLSKYHYRKTKYFEANSDFANDLTKALIEIMSYFLRFSKLEKGIFRDKRSLLPPFEMLPIKLVRPTFPKAIISYKRKFDTVIEYYPYAKDELLSGTISEIIKYIENKVRAIHKIKSRISVNSPNEGIKSIIDKYFEKKQHNTSISKAHIEKKEFNIDINAARIIDADSWKTTQKLTDYLETEEKTITEQQPVLVSSNTSAATESENPFFDLILSLTQLEYTFLNAYLCGKKNNDEIKKSGLFAEDIMDSINEKAIEFTGDIIFDIEVGNIIDCYIEDITIAMAERK